MISSFKLFAGRASDCCHPPASRDLHAENGLGGDSTYFGIADASYHVAGEADGHGSGVRLGEQAAANLLLFGHELCVRQTDAGFVAIRLLLDIDGLDVLEGRNP